MFRVQAPACNSQSQTQAKPFYSGQHIDTQCDVRTCCQGDGGRESLFYTPCLACAPMSKQLPVTLDAHTFPGSTKLHLSPHTKLFSFYLRQGSVQSQGHAVADRHPSFPRTEYFRAYSTAICLRLLSPRTFTCTSTLGEACCTRH